MVERCNGGTTALTLGYHANDMIRTITEGSRTKTFTLDPADRIRTVIEPAAFAALTYRQAGRAGKRA